MVNRLFLLVLGIFVFCSVKLYAGDYHRNPAPSLVCSQCHMMHFTQGGPGNFLHYDKIGETNAKLLRRRSIVSLCKYCHEQDRVGIGAPDIFAPPYNASGGDYEVYTFDGSKIDENKRHSVGHKIPSAAIPPFPPGMDAATKPLWTDAVQRYGDTFSCEYCHDQHGNTNYRNVRPNPMDPNDRDPKTAGAQVTYNNGPWDNTSSIAQAIVDGLGVGDDPARQYVTTNMTYRSSTHQIAEFCGRCHVKFYGVGQQVNNENELGGFNGRGDCCTNTQWLRHPVGSIAIEIGNGHTDPANFNSIPESDKVRRINSNIGNQPFCLTCHRAHGSTNHSNLVFGPPKAAGGTGSLMRDTCQQCHNQ